MDQRTDPFIRKFRSAQPHLGAEQMQDIVSLRYRDDCVNDSEYADFIDHYLRQTLGLEIIKADGDFWGQAWLVRDEHQNSVILVQHETGLEILAVDGSIASLITLLPMISSGWNWLRDRFHRHPMNRGNEGAVEIRRFNQTNILIEQQAPSVEVYVLGATLQEHALLKQRVQVLETELANLKQQVISKRNKRALPSRSKNSKRRCPPPRVAPRCIGAPHARGQHLCHRVPSVAGSGFLTVADINCDVGTTQDFVWVLV